MNENLIVPKQVQGILEEVENTPLYLAELPMEAHPKLPQFNRFIRVINLDAKSENEFVMFGYKQILKDKETGEEINIQLPTPEWVVYKDTWSYLRGTKNELINVPIKDEDGNATAETQPVKVSSYKYMLWLMKNNRATLLQLIQGYLADFVRTKNEELDKL